MSHQSGNGIDSLPKGLLSFLYNAMNNPEVHEALQDDPRALMNKFELAEDEMVVILTAIRRGSPREGDADKIGGFLASDFEENFPAYYEEFW